MRTLTTWLVLAVVIVALGTLAQAQSAQPANPSGQTSATSANQGGQPSATGATRQEVEQLRSEVAAQKKAIEELKAMVEKLAQSNPQTADGAHIVPAVLQSNGMEPIEIAAAAQKDQKKSDSASADKSAKPIGVVAGFNGEHFFIKSADGKFQIQPYGYFQSDYRAYNGDGAPSDTFLIRRARFGFQGNYGTHYDYAVLIDAAAANGITLRDLYLNVKPVSEFQVQVGQFKEPFAQELTLAVTNTDFVERGLTSLLYPAAATAYRSPGITIHGDVWGGVMQYWAGAFNGKGILTNNTTNEPEFIGRLRFYPWKKKKDNVFQGLAFGGGIGHGRTRALSNEISFGGAMPDAAFTFFPTFRINGPVERYNGEFTYLKGPLALRGEYDQLNQFRRNVGSDIVVGLGFGDLPGVVAKAWNISATYLLTGETRPENGTPKVKHPLFGPETPGGKGHGWGAWELALRYTAIQGKAPGATFLSDFTPGFVPTENDRADEFTVGVNWYPNYWIRYMVDFNVDRARNPTVGGVPAQNFFVLLQRLQFRF